MTDRLCRFRTAASPLALIVAASLTAPALAQVDPSAGGAGATQQSPPSTAAATTDDGEMMIVTGYRAAVQSAIETKLSLPVIGEAFSAEDIGKLPDTSIAETLGRLPGLATQRLDGRSQVLTIRGLGPDFSTTLLNGREQVSSSDNRGVEYDQYPSELVTSGVVYKTPFAGLIGQGLAGTVDLKTAKPLDYKDRVISVAARGEFNERGSLNPDRGNTGYRATVTYIDQFMDGKLGLALGVAYQSSPQQTQRFEAWGYPSVSTPGGDALVIGGAKPYVRTTILDRLGVFGTLEFKPNDTFHSQFDAFYSDYRENRPSRGIEFPLQWGSGTSLRIDEVTNGIVNRGAFSNVSPVVRNDFDRKATENIALGFRNIWTPTERTTVDLDLNFSRSVRKQQNIESYSGLGYARSGPTDTITFTRQANGAYNFASTVNYADTSLIRLTDPQGWGGGNDVVQAGFINAPNTTDELKQIRLAVTQKVEWGPIESIEIGGNYGDRTKRRVFNQAFLTLPGSTSSLAGGATRALDIPPAALLNSQTGLYFMGLGSQVTYDPYYLINNVYTAVTVSGSSLNFPQDWFVSEKVSQGWIKFNIDQELGDLKLTGNAGVQVVYTDQTSIGSRLQAGNQGGAGVTNATFVPVVDGAKYTYVLPSLNLTLKLSDQTQVRFGAARTLARARMDQLNASLSGRINLTRLPNTDVNLSAFSAEGGNARLRPYISDGVDLSVEHYFGRKGYVSLAGFYKHLSSFVNPSSAFVADLGFLSAQLTPAQQQALGTPLGLISGPTNDGNGDLYGLEGTISVPLDIVLPALEGLGVQTSASYTKSSIRYGGSPVSITVPGLSDWVVNSTVYYEKSGFEARLSHRFRNGFLAEVSGISANRILQSARSESIFDAQIGYRFSEGTFEGLSVTFQALNLTNAPFVTTQGGNANVIGYESYGRTYLVGATYRF